MMHYISSCLVELILMTMRKIKRIRVQTNLALHSPQNISMVVNGIKVVNPLTDDKILDQTKLKAFADDK